MEKEIVLLFTLVILDMMAVGLVVPLIPYYALDKVAMGAEYYGLLGTTFQTAQLIGSLVIGALSDTLGKKFGLLLSFIGSAISYLLLGFGNTIFIIFFSRFLVGMVKQTVAIATSIVADLPTTNEENMAKRIGRLNSCMGMGFIIGPICGGALASFSYELPTLIAASLFVICSLLTIFYLPSPASSSGHSDKDAKKSKFDFKAMTSAICNRSTGRWIFMMAILYLSFSLVRSTFSILMKEKYALSAQQNGFFMAYVGVSSALTQAFGISFFSSKIKSKNTRLIAGCIMLIFGFFSEVYSNNLWLSLFIIGVIIFGSGIMTTTITASFSQLLPKGKSGGGLGVFNGTQNIVGIIAPALAGFIAKGDVSIPFALSGSVAIGLLSFILIFPIPETNISAKPEGSEVVSETKKDN